MCCIAQQRCFGLQCLVESEKKKKRFPHFHLIWRKKLWRKKTLAFFFYHPCNYFQISLCVYLSLSLYKHYILVKWRKAFGRQLALELQDRMLFRCTFNQSGNQRKLLILAEHWNMWVSYYTTRSNGCSMTDRQKLYRGTLFRIFHTRIHLTIINTQMQRKC